MLKNMENTLFNTNVNALAIDFNNTLYNVVEVSINIIIK
jgi:hypothetical protein